MSPSELLVVSSYLNFDGANSGMTCDINLNSIDADSDIANLLYKLKSFPDKSKTYGINGLFGHADQS